MGSPSQVSLPRTHNTIQYILSVSLSPTNTHAEMAYKADPYADIDFDDVTEATGLAMDEIKCLKVCFDLFDTKKQDYLSADDLDEIMRAMGFRPSKEELDEDGSGQIEFEEFCQLCAPFLVEDPDIETM